MFSFAEEIEEEGGSGANQDEYMKEQQAKLAEEKQKLLENHGMVESVSSYFFEILSILLFSLSATFITCLKPKSKYHGATLETHSCLKNTLRTATADFLPQTDGLSYTFHDFP